jgi:hypothetical protein
MNFAFELQKDKGVREGVLFQPFKLVSLWDMLRFNADLFVNVCKMLGETSRPLDQLIAGQSRGAPVGTLLKETFAVISPNLHRISEALKLMGLPMSVISADRLIQFVNGKKENTPLNQLQQLINGMS